MKVIFSFQNNNYSKPQNFQVNFEAGLTPKMIQEIQRADVLEISSNLAKKGILTDFQENKIVAWGCEKTVDIFEQLNKKYKLKLALPKGIYVKDFNLLHENPNVLGTCNMLPSKLIKNSDERIPERTIFFNSLHNWENIDKISDNDYARGLSSTPHFLNFGLHEAIHSSHEYRLLEKQGADILAKELRLYKKEKQIIEFQRKYGERISQICNSAQADPFEAIACDIPRVIINALDEETLLPTKNPFIGTPYENLSFWQRVDMPNYSDQERPLNEILRNFWNGKFE